MSFKGGFKFSWDNVQSGGENNGEVKLNLHVSNGLTHGKACKVVQYAIKGDGARYHHHPVSYVLELVDVPSKHLVWQMNIKHFEKARDQIHNMWFAQLKKVTFFAKMRKIIKWKTKGKGLNLHKLIFKIQFKMKRYSKRQGN